MDRITKKNYKNRIIKKKSKKIKNIKLSRKRRRRRTLMKGGNQYNYLFSSIPNRGINNNYRIIFNPTDDKIIFGGIYSEKYYSKLYELKKGLLKMGIKSNNLMFKEVPQYTFRMRPNCTWCNKSCKFAFHFGESCKIEHQLELYKKYPNNLIIYLDTDVLVNENVFLNTDYTEMLGDNDICFEKESHHSTPRWVSNVNIGFTLCKPTKKIIDFYTNVLDVLTKKKHPLNWDQQVVNYLLKENRLKYKIIDGRNTGFIHFKNGGR